MAQAQDMRSAKSAPEMRSGGLSIEIEDISHSYGTGDKAVHTCDHISFSIRSGELTTFLGPSGCGKTTLLKIIAGLIKPSSGRILVDGQPVKGPGPDRALVFQNFALLPWATVMRNVAFGLELRGVSKEVREKAAKEAIAMVHLTGFENAHPHELSGGMQQRAGLARALTVNPQVLLMDEPFASVDEMTRRVFQEDLEVLMLEEKKSVIFVTHSIDEAVFLSDRIVLFSCRPSKVRDITDISIPRSRTPLRTSPEFLDHVTRLWGLLKEEPTDE